MSWIVIDDDNGRVKMVSRSTEDGLLPKGSYLTIQDGEVKFILRVDKSEQNYPYSPSPLIVDMDLSGLESDRKCQNVVYATRILDVTSRTDGKIDFIRPQSLARRSTQDEVDLAMGAREAGPRVFTATVHGGQNQLLVDDGGNFITACLPEEMFWYQMMICGKTGSGKTVALKYLAQYFSEVLEGAVLAVNVKESDFLTMNRPSALVTDEDRREWAVLGLEPKGVDNFSVFYPATQHISEYETPVGFLDTDLFQSMTLSVEDVEPEALCGLLEGASDAAARALPDIFRHWRVKARKPGERFVDFVRYFSDLGEAGNAFPAMNTQGDELDVPLHFATVRNLKSTLWDGTKFFDHEGAVVAEWDDIVQRGKMTVIDVARGDVRFGAIVLRHLLRQILHAKQRHKTSVPVLIIIDEVHTFYRSDAEQEALSDLDNICRIGRSQRIGIIFSSQSPGDIPRGLDTVINTKVTLRSDPSSVRLQTLGISADELESLRRGFAVVSVHDAPRLKIVKFPLAPAGVV